MISEEKRKLRYGISAFMGTAFLCGIIVVTLDASKSALSESGDNLQYDLAYSKANLAADEVEVKNSLSRLKEMYLLLHSSRSAKESAPLDQIRKESRILSDEISNNKAESYMTASKIDKDMKSHSPSKKAELKMLEIEANDDAMLGHVLQQKDSKVQVELKQKEDMALAMARYPGKQQLVVGVAKELQHLQGAKEELEKDASKVKSVLAEMAKRPNMAALPDRKVEDAEREAMAIERLGHMRRRAAPATR